MNITRPSIAVVIAAKNEAANIRDCLESVGWADQVFVVDSDSTDGTQAIAASLGASVAQFRYNGDWPKKRNWALDNLPITSEWVLILDADERIDGLLRDEIEVAVQAPEIDAYYMRWKFIFLNRWMKHCWNHGWMLRLFRRGSARYEDIGMRGEAGWDAEVHENIVTSGRTGRLKTHLLHDTNQDIHYWIKKQNDFSTWNAQRRLRKQTHLTAAQYFRQISSGDPVRTRAALKSIYLKMPFRPLLMFLYLYVLKLGFLDGRAGYYFCALRAAHELNIETKLFEASLVTNADGGDRSMPQSAPATMRKRAG